MKRLFIIAAILISAAVLAGCGKTYTISEKICDAENPFYTSDGRLLVTGGAHVWEIPREGKLPLIPREISPEGNFGGIAQVGNRIYVVGSMSRNASASSGIDLSGLFEPGGLEEILGSLTQSYAMNVLLCAELPDSPLAPMPPFEVIGELEGMTIPNGMASDAAGRLYIADMTLLPRGRIIRLTLSGSGPEPLIMKQETWIDCTKGVISPNGMAILGDVVYFTDLNIRSLRTSVKKVPILKTGGPGIVSTLYERGVFAAGKPGLSLFDGITAGRLRGRTGVAVADNLLGSLVFIEDTGVQKTRPDYEMDSGSFDNPAGVILAPAGTLFANDLIVTEKGMMYDCPMNLAGYGDRVTGLKVR